MRPPGYWLRAIAIRLCEPQTVERLVDPIVADLQVEHAALGDDVWRRRRMLVAAYAGFWKAIILHTASSVVHQRPDEHARLRRAVGVSLFNLAVCTATLLLPPLLDQRAWKGDWANRSILALLLVPQALPLSIPAAMCFGIFYAMRAGRATRREISVVLTVAVLASGVAWALMEWGLPRANQAFRELLQAQLTGGRRVHLEPGLNELGLSRLGRRTDAIAVGHYHLLWALCFASIPLSVFAVSVSERVRGALAAVALGFATLVLYYAALQASDSYLSAPGAFPTLAWAPNALFLIAGVGLIARSRRAAPL